MSDESEGCQTILINDAGEVLLQLRDDKDWIPFPNMWAIPGGMLEAGESAAECIRREVREELGVTLAPEEIRLLEVRGRSYGIEHAFAARLDLPAEAITLTEGQRVAWFSQAQITEMSLAYEDSTVLAEHLDRATLGAADSRE